MTIEKKEGHIHVITGPMFSGKTSRLIEMLKRYEYMAKRVVVFNHTLDEQRYGAGKISSHNLLEIDCFSVSGVEEVRRHLENEGRDVKVVAFDEVEFYAVDPEKDAEDPELVDKWFRFFHRLADEGKIVIVAGLNTNFRGEPWLLMQELLSRRPDKITFLNAICMKCQSEMASLTQRLLKNVEPAPYDDPLIKVGGLDAYQARCRFCHKVPGKPASI